MQADLPVRPGLVIPGHEIHVRASTGGGPGGQHVNKSNTRISIRWSVRESAVLSEFMRERLLMRLSSSLTQSGELVLHVHAHRSQQRNLEEARKRLAEKVRVGLKIPKHRRDTKPTRASKRKRMDKKKRRGEVKRNRGRVRRDD